VTRLPLSRVFWIGAAAILIVAALVALAAVVRGDFSDTDGRILGTLAALLLAGGTLVLGVALRERNSSRPLALAAIAMAPLGFVLSAYAIWDFVFDGGDDDSWRYGWTGVVLLIAALVAAAARLLAQTEALVRLAYATGLLAAAAAAVSIALVWQENPSGESGKVLAVLWILTALGLFLVPVLQRFTAAGASPRDTRVLATLGDVELVASRGTVEGVEVEPPAPGERLVLRRRD
jgi:FtsH-binding integral membrane protein